ncbi:helix-turn-helix transcriptional regulator [Actinoplanes sp. NPDC049118]|uniref:helix-turn-helix domain-containing protein n=1 Tax=Actinoplanes sp. NPDC049118 TaxID=3155769 RepID=UPI0033C80C3F
MADDGKRLGARLRALRETGFANQPVTQGVVATALGRSVPLVSSWEKGKAQPSEEWLNAYARFFASPRSLADGHPRLLTRQDLRDDELDRFEDLFRELLQLRTATGPGLPPSRSSADELTTRSPWEGMWHFPDQSSITLVCARLPAKLRASETYTSPESPDYVELYAYSDLDALIELYGHVYAANPGVSVRRKLADELTQDDVTNHLVLMGGVDWNPMTRRVMQSLGLPVAQDRREGSDPDVGSFRVLDHDGNATVFPSRLEGDPPGQRLIEDVAQFCRAPNPFNRKRSVTICNGNYGRGTYAAVRTLTDPRFRDRNRAYIEQRYRPEDTYSILARASIVAGEVITPDWTLPGTVLHEWSNAG